MEPKGRRQDPLAGSSKPPRVDRRSRSLRGAGLVALVCAIAGIVGIAGPFAGAAFAKPFLPLSIGLQSSRFSGRGTLHFRADSGFFVNATGAYTWRGNVTLDRLSYFTDGELHLSDEVQMPDVFDYGVSTGYIKGRWYVPVTFSQQITLGGGDIRRQDMPFVSNKMNLSRVDALVKYTLPWVRGLQVQVAAARIVSGRNVGQGTTLSAGFLYTIGF